MDINEPLVTSSSQLSADRFLFNPSHPFHRFWKLLVFMVAAYVSWLSLYVFGFVFDTTKTIWEIHDYVTCAIMFIDCLVSCNTVYVDKNTNASVTNRLLIVKHYLYGWGTMKLISVIPISVIVLPFPAINVIIVRVWACIRLVHIRKVFNTLKSWKKSSKPTLVSLVKWIEIIFMTLLAIHSMACVLYLIARTNPNPERTWLSLVEDERTKESELYDYLVSVYWSTTSFTTVGYGDIHPVNGLERMVNFGMMVFGLGLISYLTSCVNEELARSKEREERLEALREYCKNIRLSDEIRQEMFNHLRQQSQGDLGSITEHNILNSFPENIQMKVKKYMFSRRRSSLYLFDGVSASFVSHLVAKMEFQTFSSNEMVILDNDFPDKFWILLNGNMVRDIPSNNQVIPLHICGELGVISCLPHPYCVRATESSNLLTMKGTKFMKLLKVYAEDGEIILSNVLKHLAAHREMDPVLNSFHNRVQKKLNRAEFEIKVSVLFAINTNSPKLLLHLINQGSDLAEEYANGQTILHIAAWTENIEPGLIDILLQYSPDVNKRDSTNQPPISYAIKRKTRTKAVLDVFLKRGVTVPRDVVTEYCKSAIDDNDTELLKSVYNAGGDINLPLNESGDTPIYYAVGLEKVAVVQCLLELKANIHKTNNSGKSAFELAESLNSQVIYRLMLSSLQSTT